MLQRLESQSRLWLCAKWQLGMLPWMRTPWPEESWRSGHQRPAQRQTQQGPASVKLCVFVELFNLLALLLDLPLLLLESRLNLTLLDFTVLQFVADERATHGAESAAESRPPRLGSLLRSR